jgi:hypothetical protein
LNENDLGSLPIEEKPDYDYYNEDQPNGRFIQQVRGPYPQSNRGIRSDDYELGK